ncbi:MAG: AAA family ATPase [Proteobacteria bacterium]|nr:AAA family ATPase [Pseudomonadota bacterium]
MVIEGFRGFVDRVEIDLAADVIIIYGPNGVGKTSLLDAVLWAITGRIDRFAGKGDPVSLYAREGIARVELTLVEAGQVVIITRATDGTNDTVRLSEGGEELDGAVAESRLTDLLLPQLRERVAAPMTLSNVITRSVYLQQDLVRQFIETDTPAERFSLLSEVIGAGAVLELQQTLEKGRNQWSRSTNALRKETLDPLKSRLDKVNEQLARLESEVAIGETDAREETERLFRRAVELIGQTRLSVTDPPTSSSSLDRLLKEIVAERSRVERDVSVTALLLDETTNLAALPLDDSSQIETLGQRERDLAGENAILDDAIEMGLSDLSQRRQRQIEDRNKLNRAATLATLALEDLGETCPVCEQTHDIEKTRAHLQALIAASAGGPNDLRSKEKEIEALNAQRSEKRREIEGIRIQLRDLHSSQQQMQTRQSNLRARLADIGIADEAGAAVQLDARKTTLQETVGALTELLRSGEQLSLVVVRLGEQRRRAELAKERDVIQARIAEASREIDSQDKTHALAGQIIEGLRGASLKVTRKQVENVAPLFQRIYSRIDPHPTFRVTQIVTGMERGKGLLNIGVLDPDQGDDAHEAVPILSSSQLNSFAVSLFLALNLALPSLKLDLTMLDDPFQSLDSINLLGLVDVLRRVRAHRQIIVSTHEPRFLGLLQRKLRPVRSDERMMTIIFDGWTRAGPDIRAIPMTYDRAEATVLAA